MTEQEKVQFLKLQARVLQLEEAVIAIKEQLFVHLSLEEIKQLEAI